MGPFRRVILSLALVAGLVPATSFAQVPPPVPGLPDSERRTSYSITATTCACNVNFALYGDSTDFQNWIEVWLNGVRVNFNDATFGWTVTSPSGSLSSLARPITDAKVTFNSVQTGTVQIVGAVRPRRTTQFTEGGVTARNLNVALTYIVATVREFWDKLNDMTGRAVLGLPGETVGPLPASATRSGKFFTFDGSGNPAVTTPPSGGGNMIGTGPTVVNHTAAWTNTAATAIGDSGFFPVQPLTCAAHQWLNTIATSGVPACAQPQLSDLLSNPTNLYVSTTGNDSNSCLVVGSPCLTIQHAVALAQNYNLLGAPITINLAAGTYTKGVIISGVFFGQVNGNGSAPMISIIGVAGSTTIDPSTNCGSGISPIFVSDGAVVGIGSVKLQTSCAGGNDATVVNGGLLYLADNSVNFGAANNALMLVVSARFDANYVGAKLFTISGGGVLGFAGSTHATIVTGIGVANVIVGTPAFSSSFLSLLDGSFYNEGIGSTWTNAVGATGVRYAIAINSHIDREQNAGNLPGSTAGTIQGVSTFYQNNGGTSDLPCIGGTGGCRSATVPTGLGGGGAATMVAGSGDHGGNIQLALGTAAPTSGTVVISPKSILTGDYGTTGACVVSKNNGTTHWPADAKLESFFDVNGLHVRWDGTMVASTTYNVSYVCN